MPRELAEPPQEPEEVEECGVCFEPLDGKLRSLACNHRFHSGCVQRWLMLKGTCPLCRAEEPGFAKLRGGAGARWSRNDLTAEERLAAAEAELAAARDRAAALTAARDRRERLQQERVAAAEADLSAARDRLRAARETGSDDQLRAAAQERVLAEAAAARERLAAARDRREQPPVESLAARSSPSRTPIPLPRLVQWPPQTVEPARAAAEQQLEVAQSPTTLPPASRSSSTDVLPTLDGRWRTKDKERITIVGNTVQEWSSSVLTVTGSPPTAAELSYGGETYTGDVRRRSDGVTELHWSDGDVWRHLRGEKVLPRASLASPVSPEAARREAAQARAEAAVEAMESRRELAAARSEAMELRALRAGYGGPASLDETADDVQARQRGVVDAARGAGSESTAGAALRAVVSQARAGLGPGDLAPRPRSEPPAEAAQLPWTMEHGTLLWAGA